MQLPLEGVEYAKWDLDTTDACTVSFDRGATWHDLTAGTETDGIWTSGSGAVHAILVAGPDVTDPPTGAVVLTAGVHPTRVRRVDTPEVLIRTTGPVTVQ